MSDWSIKKKQLYKIFKKVKTTTVMLNLRDMMKEKLNENEKKIKVNSMRLKTQETKFK